VSVVPCCGALLACVLVLMGKAKDYDCGDLITEGSLTEDVQIKNQLKAHLLKKSELENHKNDKIVWYSSQLCLYSIDL